MPELVLDYSWARPTADEIRGAGYTGVMRYLAGGAGRGKEIDRDEYDYLRLSGFAVGLVWETTASRALDGYTAGMADAVAAMSQSFDLGFPSDRPLYYAIDVFAHADDVRPYFAGVQEVMRNRPVGCYGGSIAFEPLFAEGIVQFCWQAAAFSWSGGKISDVACLFQRAKPTHPIIGTDENVTLAADYGAAGDVPPPPPPRPPKSKKGHVMFVAVTDKSIAYLFLGGRAGRITASTAVSLITTGTPWVGNVHTLELLAMLRDLAGLDLNAKVARATVFDPNGGGIDEAASRIAIADVRASLEENAPKATDADVAALAALHAEPAPA